MYLNLDRVGKENGARMEVLIPPLRPLALPYILTVLPRIGTPDP